jgi:hypothetical protein
MSDPIDPKHDWSNIDALVPARNTAELAHQPATADVPLAGIETRIAKIHERRLGVISRFKAGQIEKRAAIAEIGELTNAHLEATKHALGRALEVHKQRVDLIAQKYIYQITEEHLRDMRDMGLHNLESRGQTLLKLNIETAKLLKQAETQDVPEFMRKKTLDAIFKKYEEFLSKITAEDNKLP